MKTICPISKKTIDKHTSQLVGLFVIILLIISHQPPSPTYSTTKILLLLFLFQDFLARSFNIRFSILAKLSRTILHLLHIKPKPIGAAPKRFAARLGLLFTTFLIIALQTKSFSAYQIIFTAFGIAVMLEAIFGFCIGCHIYTLLSYVKKGRD